MIFSALFRNLNVYISGMHLEPKHIYTHIDNERIFRHRSVFSIQIRPETPTLNWAISIVNSVPNTIRLCCSCRTFVLFFAIRTHTCVHAMLCTATKIPKKTARG